MRWDSLRLAGEESPEMSPKVSPEAPPELPLDLSGLSTATPRTFDTPGFRGMTFYEIDAKSLINKAPSGAHVPFRWTINPYRGCGHACRYCMSGDTRVLMADGRTTPLADLRVGDRIYGTERRGALRRYVVTRVLAHWSTVKPAYRITLEDGTRLVSSGDHRFLTNRGWKHATRAPGGQRSRRYLTKANRLVGTGRFAAPPPDTQEYRRGHLCGLFRGDRHTNHGRGSATGPAAGLERPGRAAFRAATDPFCLTADIYALDRLRRCLAELDVSTTEFAFRAPRSPHRTTTELRISGSNSLSVIEKQVTWPCPPSADWRKGFLAGVFDVAGAYDDSLRITHSDPDVVDRTVEALTHLGFDRTVARTTDGLNQIHIAGGPSSQLRFFHTTDPAAPWTRSLVGHPVRSSPSLKVAAVESLGVELPLYDITTGTRDFIADGIVSHNCFARNTHTYLDLDTGADFDSRVVVKVNAPVLLRRELAAPRWSGEHIAMGTNVDCYQRAEGRYRLMRPIIEALRDFHNPFSILTKGALILRDLDLLKQAAKVTSVSLAVSVGFLHEGLWRSVEPGAPSPRRRLAVVRALAEAGFKCGVLMAPMLPGLTDSSEEIEQTVAAIAEAGAARVTPLALHLRTGAREWYLGWLGREHPRLVEPYRRLYRGGPYLPRGYQRELTARVRMAARRHGLAGTSSSDTRQWDDLAGPDTTTMQRADPTATTQLTLL